MGSTPPVKGVEPPIFWTLDKKKIVGSTPPVKGVEPAIFWTLDKKDCWFDSTLEGSRTCNLLNLKKIVGSTPPVKGEPAIFWNLH